MSSTNSYKIHFWIDQKNELISLKRNDDKALYFIEEYMACKISNDYSHSVEELKEWTREKFNIYYNERKNIVGDKELKGVASLIAMDIVSNDIF